MSAAPAPLPVAILISGRGSNMLAIADAARTGRIPVRVAAVVSDRSDAAGLVAARELGLSTVALSPRSFPDRAAYDEALRKEVEAFSPGLVILAGFMRILSGGFVRAFAGRMFNIHPSLLPKYPGLHTHRRVLEAGDAWHGCTVHFVTEELDAGPAIVQARVRVQPGDNEDSLSARVHQWEHIIYPEATGWFATGRLTLREGAPWLDGARLASPVIRGEE